MLQLPTPVRVAIGLLATAIDEAKHFPDKAIEMPMLVVSTALQMSLRAQQRYAALAARGDELLSRRNISDEPPPWATFDDQTPAPPATAGVEDLHDQATGEASKPKPKPATKPTPASKTVRSPRNTAPSPFDVVGDD